MRDSSTWAERALPGLDAGCSSESPRSSAYFVTDIRPGPEDGLPKRDGKSFGRTAVYLSGSTSGQVDGLPSHGGADGFIARFTTAGVKE